MRSPATIKARVERSREVCGSCCTSGGRVSGALTAAERIACRRGTAVPPLPTRSTSPVRRASRLARRVVSAPSMGPTRHRRRQTPGPPTHPGEAAGDDSADQKLISWRTLLLRTLKLSVKAWGRTAGTVVGSSSRKSIQINSNQVKSSRFKSDHVESSQVRSSPHLFTSCLL